MTVLFMMIVLLLYNGDGLKFAADHQRPDAWPLMGTGQPENSSQQQQVCHVRLSVERSRCGASRSDDAVAAASETQALQIAHAVRTICSMPLRSSVETHRQCL
jgi:hypothetical protein